MKKSGPNFVFKTWAGEECENQAKLSEYYIHLYGECPSVNCLVSYDGKRFAVFDGHCWRHIDLKALINASKKRK